MVQERASGVISFPRSNGRVPTVHDDDMRSPLAPSYPWAGPGIGSLGRTAVAVRDVHG